MATKDVVQPCSSMQHVIDRATGLMLYGWLTQEVTPCAISMRHPFNPLQPPVIFLVRPRAA